MTSVRVFAVGLRFHVKALTHSVFFLLTSIFMPLLVATVAYYMYRAGNQAGSLLYVSLGAACLVALGAIYAWQVWRSRRDAISA